jgi:hypothetical protein
MKILTTILLLLSFNAFGIIKVNSITSPNESKIYYHIHQATRWAEIHHSKKYLFSKHEMDEHLGKLKYSEINLVKSKFYKNYVYLTRLARNLNKSSYVEIEKFRKKIHTQAESLSIKHPENWREEFTLKNIKSPPPTQTNLEGKRTK